MQDSDIRVVRGVSIAVIVLSGLSILSCLLLMVASAVGAAATPELIDESYYGTAFSDDYDYYDYYSYGHSGTLSSTDATLDSENVAELAAAAFGFLGVLAAIALVLSAVSLVAGILGLRNARTPDKLGGAFGWGIAGAVCALLMGRVATTVLLIVSAVYISRLRKGSYSQDAYGYGYAPQPAMGCPQPQYAPQSQYAQPQGQQAGYAQSQPPIGYAQPQSQPQPAANQPVTEQPAAAAQASAEPSHLEAEQAEKQ